jgi:hypothetical protein
MTKPATGQLDPNEIYLAHEIATRITPPPRPTIHMLPPPSPDPVWLDEPRVAEPVAEAESADYESLDIELPRSPAGRVFVRLTRGAQARMNKWVVTAYKLIGFAILTLVVLALVSYLGANLFYVFSTSWVAPTVIAPTDEHVLALKSKLADEESARDQVIAGLADADRVIAMHAEYLGNARKALVEELADRKSELASLHAIDHTFASTRAEVKSDSRAWSSLSKQRLSAEYDAHLIDREAALSGALQLSQLAQGNLNLAEHEMVLSKRRAELIRDTDALAAAVSHQPAHRHSLEVLRILQELKRAQLELAKAGDERQVLQKSLARHDEIVRSIAESPYLLAVAQKSTIAFTPYANLAKVKPGAPLYACSLGLFWCRQVGQVVAVLPGEVSLEHPLQKQTLRGQSVQLRLTDAKAAEDKTLFAGGRPLLF